MCICMNGILEFVLNKHVHVYLLCIQKIVII
jgi:hypothetical protein